MSDQGELSQKLSQNKLNQNKLEVFSTEFGKPSFDLLRERLTHHKNAAPNPFAPVTIISPPGQALTSIAFGASQGQNLAGVIYTTFSRLAQMLAGSPLAPINQLQKIAVLRSLLANEDERLLDDFMVKDSDGKELLHPSTQDVLLQVLDKLEHLSAENLEFLKNSHPKVLKIYEAYLNAIKAFNIKASKENPAKQLYSNIQLLEEAAKSAKSKAELKELLESEVGPILTYIVEPPLESEQELLLELAKHTPVEVVACLTGNLVVDEEMNDWLENIAPNLVSHSTLSPAVSSPAVSSYPLPIEEARAVRTEILNELRAGTAPYEMAILYATADPYQQLLLDVLDEAEEGIPISMQTGSTLLESIAGRALDALLDMAENGYSKASARKLLETKFHADPKELVDFRHNASRFQITPEEILELLEPAINNLPALDGESWEGKTQILKTAMDSLIETNTSFTVSREKSALDEVQNILVQSEKLDDLGSAPNLYLFAEIIRTQLRRPHGRKNRFGRGVFIGHISQAEFLDLSHIWVVGLADGIYPTTFGFSPIISFPHWDQLAKNQPSLHRFTFSGAARRQRRHLISAIKSARQQVKLFFPIALGGALSGVSGEPTYLLEELKLVESDTAILNRRSRLEDLLAGDPDKPSSYQEYNLLALGQKIEPDSAAFHRAKELLKARSSHELTPFDGWVTDFELDPDYKFSATQLENFTDCPQGYFFRHVLGVRGLDYSEADKSLSPAEEGSFVHKILEKFYSEQDHSKGELAATSLGTTRLEAIAREEFMARYANQENELSLIREEQLIQIMEHLNFFKKYFEEQKGLKNIANEKEDEFQLRLNRDKEIALKVRIDRIDEYENIKDAERGIIALDYKTGSTKRYKNLTGANPLNHWATLQHFIYALYLAKAYGEYDKFRGGYIFSKNSSGTLKKNPIVLELTPELRQTATQGLAEIINLLERGIFPPGIWSRAEGLRKEGKKTDHSCGWCDPDKPTRKYGLQNFDLHNRLLQKRIEEMPLREVLYPTFLARTNEGAEDKQMRERNKS